jgi:hypothetical protein
MNNVMLPSCRHSIFHMQLHLLFITIINWHSNNWINLCKVMFNFFKMYFAPCNVIQLYNTNQWSVQECVWVGRRVYSRHTQHFPIHQTAHNDACTTYRTACTTVSLKMNPRGSKHVEEQQKLTLIYKTVHFIGLCCIMVTDLKTKINLNYIRIFSSYCAVNTIHTSTSNCKIHNREISQSTILPIVYVYHLLK